MPVKQISLVPASEKDAAVIAELAAKIWRVHYPPIIGEKQVEYMLEWMYSSTSIHDQMSKGQAYYFITLEEVRIGYLSVTPTGPQQLMLNKFYIDTSLQGKGAGRAAYQCLLGEFPEVREIRLTVNRKNYKSINFYYAQGFVIEEVKDFDIGSGYLMEDFIMVHRRG